VAGMINQGKRKELNENHSMSDQVA
jgi:hypothetical protein